MTTRPNPRKRRRNHSTQANTEHPIVANIARIRAQQFPRWDRLYARDLKDGCYRAHNELLGYLFVLGFWLEQKFGAATASQYLQGVADCYSRPGNARRPRQHRHPRANPHPRRAVRLEPGEVPRKG